MPIRPGQGEGGDEGAAAIGIVTHLARHPGHGGGIVAATIGGHGPIGGIDPGGAAQRRDHQAAIIGQRGQPGGARRRQRLDGGILLKTSAGLGRFGQAEFAGTHHIEAAR